MNMTAFSHLCYVVFIASKEGKMLIDMMERLHLETPIFPVDAAIMEKHGGAVGWSGFRAGQLDIVHRLKALASDYEAKVLADSKKQS